MRHYGLNQENFDRSPQPMAEATSDCGIVDYSEHEPPTYAKFVMSPSTRDLKRTPGYYASSEILSSSDDELSLIPQIARRCVRTRSGRFAHLIAFAEDERESVGLLKYDDGTQEVRRKSSFDKAFDASYWQMTEAIEPDPAFDGHSSYWEETPPIEPDPTEGQRQDITPQEDRNNFRSKFVRTRSGRFASLLLSAEDDSEIVSVVEYNDGQRQVRRAASLHCSAMSTDDVSLSSKSKSRPRAGVFTTHSRFSYAVYSDDESDFEDALERKSDATPYIELENYDTDTLGSLPYSVSRGITITQHTALSDEVVLPEYDRWLEESIQSPEWEDLADLDRMDSFEILTPLMDGEDEGSSIILEPKVNNQIFEEKEKEESRLRRLSLSADRLGWIGQDECEELFGISISTIKKRSPRWWKTMSEEQERERKEAKLFKFKS